jgi:hypothetical protein
VKIILLFTLAAVLHGAAFAQKIQDPELRHEHAANPTKAQSHKSKAVTARPVRSKTNSASELAKIEQSGIKKTSTRKRTRAANPGHTELGSAAQGKNKSAKFSYHPPKTHSKGRGNGGRAVASSRPSKGPALK